MTLLPLVINTLLITLLSGSRCVDGHVNDRKCPMNFNFFFTAYNSCTDFLETGPKQKQITGGEVIRRFQEICSSRPRIQKCKSTILEGCSPRHLELYQSAMNTSLWFCNDDNHLRDEITRALIGSVDVPERETSEANCIGERSDFYSCPNIVLNRERFDTVREYGDVIFHDAQKVLSHPLSQIYFKELFDCYFIEVNSTCPHNAIPLAIDRAGHLFSPPKFGINVSEIILNKAAELRGIKL